MNQKWHLDPTWEGDRTRIKNDDGRTVAIILWTAKPEVEPISVVRLFTAAIQMYGVCKRLSNQGFRDVENIGDAEELVNWIEGKE